MPITEDDHFDLLTGHLAETIEGLPAIQPDDARLIECEELLIKLLLHTLSMRQLYNRPQPLPGRTPGLTVYDFPTAIVIARTAFETYLTLFDVFLSPETPEEFEFRYLLWRIKGYIALQSFDTVSSFGAAQHKMLMGHLDEFRTKLQATPRFQTMSQGQKNTALNKGKDESQPQRDYEAAGFAADVAKRIYGFTSSYVHSDGHAAYQIRSARTHEAQRNMFEMSISFALMAVARTILGIENLFPAITSTTKARPLARMLVDVYAEVAMRIGNPIDRETFRQQLREFEEE